MNRTILHCGLARRMAARSNVMPRLACMNNTECQGGIIDALQDGQHGPSFAPSTLQYGITPPAQMHPHE